MEAVRRRGRAAAARPAMAIIGLSVALGAGGAPPPGAAAETGAGAAPARIVFEGDLDATLAATAAEGTPVALYFVAGWCPVCARMARETLRDPDLLALAGRFRWVKIDIDRHLSLARARGIDAIPSFELLDPHGNLRRRLIGFQTADQLGRHLRAHLEEIANPSAPPSVATVRATGGDHLHSTIIWTPEGYRSRAICFSHVGYGPLRLTSQSPFQTLRLGIRPRTPSTLSQGQTEFTLSSAWVNVWARDPEQRYFLDFETLEVAAALSYGISNALEIEAAYVTRSRFGGVMDGFVQGFHDLFGIDQGGRDQVSKNAFHLELEPGAGRAPVALTPADRGAYSRSLQVTVQNNVTCGTARLPAISYAGTARLETSDSDLGEGGLDLGASAAIARRLDRFYLYGTFGFAWFGRDSFHGLELRDTQWSLLTAGEWRFRPWHTLLIQYLVTEGAIRNFGPFSSLSHEITLGYKWELRPRALLEVGLIENLFTFDNSPDFGLHVGLLHRL